ncbi:C40 family peptidase [uncultured Holdemanella sp.]|uniref:C40 family peptidase n=1 Tax=uncultured Holdemanella sp. TaxID=1763549 RepID=UPI0025D281EF|nr:NlpC/P60 family protein [uncultured Holdemanella sp.]
MNFVENNGKKVAAILCVASAFPVVATVVAAKEEPGWHGDRYVNEDKTVAKGWQEIEGKSYYFSEDGTVNSSKTEEATTASVSSNITGEVKETVATASQEAVKEETEEKAAEVVETVAETPATTTEATDTTETPAEAPAETPAAPEETAPVETPAAPVETPTETAPVETPAAPEVTTPAETAPAETPAAPAETAPAETAPVETPAAPEETAPVETPAAPEETTPVETPATPEETTPVETPAATTLGQRISSEAQKLVGVTDGLWCTQVVQQALANAGVSDAYQLWPDQYAGQYGYYTNDPQEGDLLYYNNGGRGVDHIAIYIGNGQAVHGNYEGKTVIASAYLSTAASPQFIRVVR